MEDSDTEGVQNFLRELSSGQGEDREEQQSWHTGRAERRTTAEITEPLMVTEGRVVLYAGRWMRRKTEGNFFMPKRVRALRANKGKVILF